MLSKAGAKSKSKTNKYRLNENFSFSKTFIILQHFLYTYIYIKYDNIYAFIHTYIRDVYYHTRIAGIFQDITEALNDNFRKVLISRNFF